MLGRVMITLCSEIYIKYVRAMCGHKEEILNVFFASADGGDHVV
jgi:hypothetical protein